MKNLQKITIALGLLLLLSLYGNIAHWNSRSLEIPYGTYSLDGSRFTSAEFLTFRGDGRYTRYQDGKLLSQGTVAALEQFGGAVYLFTPDNGSPLEYYFRSGDAFYQIRGDTPVSFEMFDKRAAYCNFHP